MEFSDIQEKFQPPPYLVCPVCLDVFKDPRLLSCSHTVCFVCIEGIVNHRPSTGLSAGQGHRLHCPVCRAQVTWTSEGSGVADLPTNRAIEDVVRDWRDRVKTQRLSWLKDLLSHCVRHSKEANIWCINCKINICETCCHDKEAEGHASHTWTPINNFYEFCGSRSMYLDEWIALLPKIEELFAILKILGVRESQINDNRDKFLSEVEQLQERIINHLSLKIAALVADINMNMAKPLLSIHNQRDQVLKAVQGAVAKFESMYEGSSESQVSEAALFEFQAMSQTCSQLCEQYQQLHLLQIDDQMTDVRHIAAVCLRKVERFKQLAADADFLARPLVTLLPQLEGANANTNSRTSSAMPPTSLVTWAVSQPQQTPLDLSSPGHGSSFIPASSLLQPTYPAGHGHVPVRFAIPRRTLYHPGRPLNQGSRFANQPSSAPLLSPSNSGAQPTLQPTGVLNQTALPRSPTSPTMTRVSVLNILQDGSSRPAQLLIPSNIQTFFPSGLVLANETGTSSWQQHNSSAQPQPRSQLHWRLADQTAAITASDGQQTPEAAAAAGRDADNDEDMPEAPIPSNIHLSSDISASQPQTITFGNVNTSSLTGQENTIVTRNEVMNRYSTYVHTMTNEARPDESMEDDGTVQPSHHDQLVSQTATTSHGVFSDAADDNAMPHLPPSQRVASTMQAIQVPSSSAVVSQITSIIREGLSAIINDTDAYRSASSSDSSSSSISI